MRVSEVRLSGASVGSFVVISVVVILIGLGAYLGSIRQEGAARAVEHRYQVVIQLERILSSIKDAETGQRGYLLTGDNAYLEPYDDARSAIGDELASFHALTRDSPEARDSTVRLDGLVQEKLAVMQGIVEAAKAGRRPAAIEAMQSGRGKRLMDQLRQVVGQLQTVERIALSSELARVDDESRQALWFLGISVPLVLALLGIVAHYFFREVNSRHRSMAAEMRAIHRLSGVGQYVFALAVVVAAAALRWWLAHLVGRLPPYITFYPAVLLVAIVVGGGPGTAAVLVSAVLADFLPMDPGGSLAISHPSDLIALAIFVSTNLVLCLVADRMRDTHWEEYRRLRTLLQGIKEFAIFMLDEQGLVATWNPGAAQLQGYAAAEILGGDSAAFYTPEDRDQGLPERILEAARRDGLWRGEGWRLRKDGSRFWAGDTVTAIRDAHGAVVGFGKVLQDVTGRKRAEEELLKLNARFAVAAEAAGLGFWEYDAGAHTLLWDDQMFRLYGRTRAEGLQPYELWADSLHPEDRARAERAVADGVSGAGKFDMEFRIRRPDGEVRHLRASSGVVRSGSGDGLLMYGVNIDVTERRRADEQFRLALEAAPTGMLMIDGGGTIVLVNEQIERLFGYPRAELLGQPLEKLVPPRFRSAHPGLRRGYCEEPQSRAMGAGRDLYGLRKDGREVPIEIGLNPLQTTEGGFVLSSVVDITDRKDALKQLHALNADLETRILARTHELRERETLLQEIHHRVKNNLQVISSLINMQIRTLAEPASRGALEQCQGRVQTMAQIHEMLYQSQDYARVPFSKFATELTSRVLSASGMLATAITLQLEMLELLLPVDKAIPCGLILNELMANILKHAFPGRSSGTILVGLRRSDAGDIVLTVSDDGVGIAPEFEPATSKSLGVQLVVTLVEQLEGSLRIVRERGTRFEITFPL